MTTPGEIAGRRYPRVYNTSGRADAHKFILDAIEAAGARTLYASDHRRAPVFIGIEIGEERRMGLLIYPFRATRNIIRNRPSDEHRLQIRYGGEQSWEGDHPVAFDPAGLDTTLVLGVHPSAGILVGLDPLLYNPLPMGISIEFKDADVAATVTNGWHAWERVNRPGRRREASRSLSGIETLIAFRPDKLVAYAQLEREALTLGLDPILRMRAAHAAMAVSRAPTARHLLEDTFHLTGQDILEIISHRKRLTVAVRGGVAEHHLIKELSQDHQVSEVEQIDSDGPPDAIATMRDGRHIRIECKNGDETFYANGDGRVEVQKTRASKGDPASRYYETSQFDVLAVCLWPTNGKQKFVYRATQNLPRHPEFPDRLAVLHRIDDTWSTRLSDALEQQLLG